MRTVNDSILITKERIRRLVGVPLVVKVMSGRGKSSLYHGEVTAVFPAVFSIRTDSGEVKTFSYSDVHSGNVLFLKPKDRPLIALCYSKSPSTRRASFYAFFCFFSTVSTTPMMRATATPSTLAQTSVLKKADFTVKV